MWNCWTINSAYFSFSRYCKFAPEMFSRTANINGEMVVLIFIKIIHGGYYQSFNILSNLIGENSIFNLNVNSKWP